jgi:hypothetical protein
MGWQYSSFLLELRSLQPNGCDRRHLDLLLHLRTWLLRRRRRMWLVLLLRLTLSVPSLPRHFRLQMIVREDLLGTHHCCSL